MPVGLGIQVLYDLYIYHWVNPENNSVLSGNYPPAMPPIIDIPMNSTQISDFNGILEVGEKYIWTVTARVLSNGSPVSIIDNGGVSAPCTFTYGEQLSLTDQLADGLEIELFTEPSAERKGKAWWTVTDNTPNQGLSNFDEFIVEYRKQPTGNEGFEIPWFSKTVNSFEHFIYQLEPSTTYEVKVSGVIAGTVGDPTPVKTFTTPDPRVYNCGESDLPYLPSTYTPLENATVGTQVQIGQFTMTMTEVNEFGGGHYAGKGTIPIAFLGGAKAKVRFDDILIDTEYRVHEGRVDVITQGLESWLDDQMIQFIDPYYVNGVIDSAWVDTVAGVAWVTVDGVDQQFTFDPPHYPIIVNDENGNQYTIYPNGTIVVGSFLAISENWNAMPDEVIHFAQNDSELRGFDGKEHIQWHENYEIMMLGDSSKYFVANKSMAKDEADYVNVEIPSGVSASFQLSDGTPINASPLQGSWLGESFHTGSTKKTLTLPAQSSTGNYSIYAIVNNEKVGQLNIKVYSKKERELVVVPIASTNLTAAQIIAELDETLGEANIEVDVEIAPQWNNSEFTPTTEISLPEESGLLSNYSEQQRRLRDAYFEANPNAPKNKYYLFLVDGFDNPDEVGYMVRGKALGFVSVNQTNVLNTISHELAHGMGALEHSWKDNGPDRGTTHNLMDYDESSNQLPKNNLIKAQWKELRDLDILPSLFDDVDDYMSQMAQFSAEIPSEQALSTIQYEYIEESLVSVDDALMVNGGWYVKFKTPSRSKFTHFCLVNGKVVGLFNNNEFLALSVTGYRSTPVENEEYDVEVTGESHVIRFLTTDTIQANQREYKTALKGSDTTKLIQKYVHSDIRGFTYIDVVTCNEINGIYVDGKSNGIVTYDTIQCPEESDCNQNDILAIIENDKQAIKNEFLSIIQSANGGFNWSPVRFIEGQNDIITTKDVDVITEKVQTLNHYRNNTIVGVVSLKGLLNNLYTVDILNQMVSDVVDEVSLDYPDKKLVLFLAHYIKKEENGVFITTPYTCQRVSFATNDSELIDPSFTTLDLMNAPDATNAFLSLFTNLKKPYHIINVYEKFDGTLAIYESENLTDPSTDRTGLPYIKEAHHLVSKYKAEYFEAVAELRSSIINFSPDSLQTGVAFIDTFLSNQRQLYANLKGNLDANILYWETEKLDKPQFWIAGDIDFKDIREHYITLEVIRSEFIIKKGDVEFFADLAMANGWSVGASNASIYYEFDVMTNVVDPMVYAAIDVLGVVPVIDYLADGAGLIYSAIRGNGENILIYSSALAVPFVGAAVIKTGEKIYAVFAKKVNEQLVDISVKQMDEVSEEWTRISNEIATDETQDQSVKQAMEDAVEQFDKNAAKKIISLEEEIEGFIEGVINGIRRYDIESEIASGATEITRLVTMGNKSMTLKWKVVNGAVDFTSPNVKSSLRSQLTNFLGTTSGIDAHHILPLGKCNHVVVRSASKNGYHPNIPESIVGLEHYDAALQVGLHQNHPAYDKFIQARLDDFAALGDLSPASCNNYIQSTLIPELKSEIFNAKNSTYKNLNSYFNDYLNPLNGIY